ncbi:hypothetical protein [Kaarinaea lacus]
MLRLISVIGIAIAMVIGFIAISSNMKDDYTIRSRVVDVLKQMKDIAANELQCASTKKPVAEVEISPAVDPIPLIDAPDTASSEQSVSSEQGDETSLENLDNPDNDTGAGSENQSSTAATLENNEIKRNADIVKTMGYRITDAGNVEVTVLFKDVNSESGKLKIRADSRIVIDCSCVSSALSCTTAESNISKNYLPKSLTKQ